ncbi:MAG TPA: FliM/FliN family flagellar motor switch protein [Bryobacteraceae bacterium]|nr:FliM/FliN family flagellar motor switch protein [Bryobacteraceae bacterium]
MSDSQMPRFGEVPIQVSARVPCGRLPVSELLAMEPGSIVFTERAAGDSVDILVADQVVAQAELIVIENRFAVRLSDFTERK